MNDLAWAAPAIAVVLVACALVVTWLRAPAWAERRRARWRGRPFPHAWRRLLRRHVPGLQTLPPPLQQRLRQHVQVFLAEVPIIGCRGVVVTDAMRLTIAALACLLLLGRHERFHGLREVLLYPSAFVVPQVSATPGGVVHEQRQVLAGQSWSRGQVILAWDAVQHDAAHPASGRNVVLHEFAHQLDQETGAANGAPPMGSRDQAAQWSQVMAQAWQALHARLARGELGVLDPYGATDAAEFFAVATEAFYGRPHELRGEQPELYGVLARWYGVHPAAW
jgi:Mlc titration factor MtfA (ptsG expression regulator)